MLILNAYISAAAFLYGVLWLPKRTRETWDAYCALVDDRRYFAAVGQLALAALLSFLWLVAVLAASDALRTISEAS